jgi:hypothetical protein
MADTTWLRMAIYLMALLVLLHGWPFLATKHMTLFSVLTASLTGFATAWDLAIGH